MILLRILLSLFQNTLVVYTLIPAVTLFFAYLGVHSNRGHDGIRPSNAARVWCAWWTAIVFYTLMLGLRMDVGADYVGTKFVFQDIINGQFGRSPDIIYLIFTPVVEFGHLNFFIAFMAFVNIFFIFKNFENKMKILPFYLMFFFTLQTFLSTLSMMRQSAAFFILFYAMNCFLDRRYKQFVCYYIFAFIFHKSCLLVLPFLFLFKYDLFKQRWLQYALLFSCFIFGARIFELVTPYVSFLDMGTGEGYDIYIEQFEHRAENTLEQIEEHEGSGLFAYFILMLNCITIYYSKQLKDRYKHYHIVFFYNFFILGSMMAPVVQFNIEATRVNQYIEIHRLYIYAILVYNIFSSKPDIHNNLALKNKHEINVIMKIVCIMILFLSVIFYYRTIMSGQEILLTPWQWIFQI